MFCLGFLFLVIIILLSWPKLVLRIQELHQPPIMEELYTFSGMKTEGNVFRSTYVTSALIFQFQTKLEQMNHFQPKHKCQNLYGQV